MLQGMVTLKVMLLASQPNAQVLLWFQPPGILSSQ